MIQDLKYAVHKLLQTILVQVVHVAHRLEREENACGHRAQRCILVCDQLDFLERIVGLGSFCRDDLCLLLERFESLDQWLVFKDFTFRLVKCVKKLIF